MRDKDRAVRRVFSRNLKKLRRNKGWSQEKLGEESRVDPKHTGQIERGKASATIDVVAKFARALSVNSADLLAKEVDRKGPRVFTVTRKDLDLMIRALRVAERIRRGGG